MTPRGGRGAGTSLRKKRGWYLSRPEEALLRHLVERPCLLITKDDLLTAVWRDTIVSDAALASCIRDLRRALGDSPGQPRYIETVHRRGFRFIGPIAGTARAPSGATAPPPAVSPPAKSTLVGRETELARLRGVWAKARGRQRQLVFVTGEPGIGKTALVEAFLAQIGEGESLRVGRGQCVEHHGAGEAYLPVLEALGGLARAPGDRELVDALVRYAPTWMAQLPAFLTGRDVEAVQRRAQGATRDRMLRELVEALDAVSSDSPLVLVLEDLHWSDSATVDLLAMLARRREASRLLVLGTYRPGDVAASARHLLSVKGELELHGQCEELPLQFLDAAAVAEYLARRFPRGRVPPEVALALHRNTDGNPLFLVNAVEYLVAQGQMRDLGGRWELSAPVEHIASAVPDTLWQMVERQIERLAPAERAMLTVASAAGAEFSAAVATADGIDRQDGERLCEALARRGQFLRAAGVAEWPDGTTAGRYAFIHALYQQVFYGGVSAGRREDLHLRIGECLERGHGQRAAEIAGELAVHFERGRDFERAVSYRRQAGDNALRHHGYREAADHARRALELLAALPDARAHRQEELALQVMLGAALAATQGFAGPEVARIYARARALCDDAGDDPRLFPVLLGLGRFHNIRGEVEIAREMGRRLLAIADATRDVAVRLAAHNALGIMAFHGGEFDAALAHLDEGRRLYDPEQHGPGRSAVFRVGQDPGVSCIVYAAGALQVLGYPARAAARMQEALALARSLAHPFSLAYACHFAAEFHQCRRERAAAQALEDESVALSTEHGFRLFLIAGAMHQGWFLSEQARGDEGVTRIREGLAAWRAIGAELRRPAFLALLAEVCGKVQRPGEGLAAVSEGLVAGAETGQHYWDAELHRLRGALTLQSDEARIRSLARSHGGGSGTSPARSETTEREAEAAFLEAVAVARRQKAKSLELRAVTGLCRLWATQRKTGQAHTWLAAARDWFTEGFDTADLSEARSLLEDLARLEHRPAGTSPREADTTRRSSRGSDRPR